jgi:hypothetical protein
MGTVDIVREQMPLAVLAFGIIFTYVVIAVRNALR